MRPLVVLVPCYEPDRRLLGLVDEIRAEGCTAPIVIVPAKSRFGNTVTRLAFARSTGCCVQDTQTGLRAYPADLLGWLQGIAGERFDYELDVLLQAAAEGRPIHEVPIETIYLEGNASSHFRPIVDSVRVYAPLVRFSLSSLTAFAVDFVAVLLLMSLTGQLALSVAAARLASATTNFVVNRGIVFDGGRSRRVSAARRYVALAGVLLLGNYALLRVLHGPFHLPLVLAKLATEASLFALSYQLQRRIVFRPVAAPTSVHSAGPDVAGDATAAQRVPSVLSARPDDRPATSRA
jgi:putative flippase GtrA